MTLMHRIVIAAFALAFGSHCLTTVAQPGEAVPQLTFPNCGVWAVANLAECLDLPLTSEDLVDASPELNHSKASFASLIDVAEPFGLKLKALRGASFEALKRLKPPFIIGVDSNHLVLIERLDEEGLWYSDLLHENAFLSNEESKIRWSGEVLLPIEANRQPDSFPPVFFLNRSLDYGTVYERMVLEGAFVGSNRIDMPIEVELAQRSCSCVSIEPIRQTVEPGEAIRLDVKVDLAQKSRSVIHESFNLRWRPHGAGESIFETIPFEVRAELASLEPNAMPPIRLELFEGVIVSGEPVSRLQREDAKGWRILEADWRSVSFGELSVEKGQILLEPDGKLPIGSHQSDIAVLLNSADGQHQKRIELPVSLLVISEIRYEPAALDFGLISNDSVPERLIEFINPTGGQLVLVELPDELALASQEALEDGRLRLKVTPASGGRAIVDRPVEISIQRDGEILRFTVHLKYARL